MAFWQGVVVSALFLILSIALASRGKRRPTYEGKGLKLTIVLANVMTYGGLFLFASNVSQGGFNNIYTGMGFSLFFLGLCLKYIARFFTWWHK